MRSEFGRGYATCLLQFVFHEPRLTVDAAVLKIYEQVDPGRGDSRNVELWANGASDHLYEMITGPHVPVDDRNSAKTMQAEALDCGHGFKRHDWTMEEAQGWLWVAKNLLMRVGDPQTLDEAMEIDLKLGLRPEKGQWHCSEPVKPWI